MSQLQFFYYNNQKSNKLISFFLFEFMSIFFRSGHILLKYLHIAEPNEKSIFRFTFSELQFVNVFTIHRCHTLLSKCHRAKKKFFQKWSNLHERCTMNGLKQMKNQFSDFYFPSYSWLYLLFAGDTPYYTSVTSQKKCPSKVVKFTENLPILSTNMTISQKLKIGRLIFHSFQHIPHLSCKYL